MSSIFSLTLSACVKSVNQLGDTHQVVATHYGNNSLDTFEFNFILRKDMAPPTTGEYILIVDAIPMNSISTPTGYEHCQRLISTNRTQVLPSTKDAIINSVVFSGRLVNEAVTGSGTSKSGKDYVYTRIQVIGDYWNGTEAVPFTLSSTYWRAALKGLYKGNGVIVKGALKSERSTDGENYFNLMVNEFNYGTISKNNMTAA